MLAENSTQVKYLEFAFDFMNSGDIGDFPKGKGKNHFATSLLVCCYVFLRMWHECSFLDEHSIALVRGSKCWIWCALYLDAAFRFVCWTSPGYSGKPLS